MDLMRTDNFYASGILNSNIKDGIKYQTNIKYLTEEIKQIKDVI